MNKFRNSGLGWEVCAYKSIFFKECSTKDICLSVASSLPLLVIASWRECLFLPGKYASYCTNRRKIIQSASVLLLWSSRDYSLEIHLDCQELELHYQNKRAAISEIIVLLCFYLGFFLFAFVFWPFFHKNHHTGDSLFLQTELLSVEAEVANIKKLF